MRTTGSNKSGSRNTAGLCCCLLAFVLYYNTLEAGFVYDDRRAVLSNPDVLESTPWSKLLSNDFWGTPLTDTGSHGSYRPLCVLSFRLNHSVGGIRPFGYHLVNVLLHCMATALVVRVARVLLPPGWGAAIAGALFASHPVHSEAVAGVVGRADLAACNFYLLTFLAYVSHVRWRESGDSRQWSALGASLAFAVASILCKETAATALLVCALYDVARIRPGMADKKRLRSLGVLGLSLVAMLHWRLSLPGPTTIFSSADNPVARSSSLITRFLTFLYLPAFNFQLLVSPVTLSFDWGMDAIPRVTSVFDSRMFITVTLYAALGSATWYCIKTLRSQPDGVVLKKRVSRKRLAVGTECICSVCRYGLSTRHSSSCRAINNNNSPPPAAPCACPLPQLPLIPPPPACAALVSLAMMTLPFLPATNLFFYVGFVVAERVLYLPSVGYCLLVGLGVEKLLNFQSSWLPRRANRQRVSGAVLAIVLVAFCARTIRRNLDWRDEESLYRSAIPVNPPKALGNLGSVLSAQGRTAEAKEALLGALRHRPNMADVHYNLGVLLQNQQDYSGAVESFQRAIHFRPSLALAYLNLGASLISLGRCQEASSVLRRGSRLDGAGLRDRAAHEGARLGSLLQLGGLYAEQGRLQRALAVYREALHTLPENYPPQGIYHRLGDTLARLQQWTEAERFHRAALRAQPDHVAAHLSYGNMLAQNSSRASEAEQWFKRAQRLAPSDPSVHHHYGEFLASLSRHEEACEQRVRAAELSPTEYNLVVAAATALRLLDRKQEAERWYRQAVSLRPEDARAHTNLGAILHLQGKPMQAAVSYREALRLQPGDPTTVSNLAKLGVVGT